MWQKDVKRVCNVGRNCHQSNLRVKPEKGKAILWYSHGINNATGWMGDADPYSVHGGCDVKKGRKWIANNWISVSESRIDDVQFWVRKLLNSGLIAMGRIFASFLLIEVPLSFESCCPTLRIATVVEFEYQQSTRLRSFPNGTCLPGLLRGEKGWRRHCELTFPLSYISAYNPIIYTEFPN